MTKKIHVVILKETEIVDDGQGGFKEITKGIRKVPCFISNYSLKVGKELGLTEGSLLSDMLSLMPLANLNAKELNNLNAEAFRGIDEVDMMKLIFLGCIGANKKIEMDFDEFTQLYQGDFSETLMLYVQLLQDSMGHMSNNSKNQFAEGLQKSTSKKQDKFKKKSHHHKSISNA